MPSPPLPLPLGLGGQTGSSEERALDHWLGLLRLGRDGVGRGGGREVARVPQAGLRDFGAVLLGGSPRALVLRMNPWKLDFVSTFGGILSQVNAQRETSSQANTGATLGRVPGTPAPAAQPGTLSVAVLLSQHPSLQASPPGLPSLVALDGSCQPLLSGSRLIPAPFLTPT